MATDLAIACGCGAVEGVLRAVSPARGTRLVCHCGDCQAFARHSGAEGVMNADGGTEIFQTLPGRVSFRRGAERLVPVRLSEAGLLRWMAACCGTPMGNTLPTPSIPFVGLPVAALPDPAGRAALGPIRASLCAAEAPEGADPPADFGRRAAMRRGMLRLLASKLRLAPRGTPYFDEAGAPVAAPVVLSPEEAAAARRPAGSAGAA